MIPISKRNQLRHSSVLLDSYHSFSSQSAQVVESARRGLHESTNALANPDTKKLINEVFSCAAKSSFIFRFSLESLTSPEKSKKKVAASDLEVLLISEGFFEEVPNLINDLQICETNQLLKPLNDEYKAFTSKSKELLEQPVLEPYIISNRTKIHFKNDQAKMQSLLDIIEIFRKENRTELTLYFKSTLNRARNRK